MPPERAANSRESAATPRIPAVPLLNELLPKSLSFRAARIVAAKRIASFPCSPICVTKRKRGRQNNSIRRFLKPESESCDDKR